jgi:hypothetical protein
MGSIVKVGYSQIVTPNSADADPTVDSTMVSGLVSGGPVSLFYGFIGKFEDSSALAYFNFAPQSLSSALYRQRHRWAK